jgi:hypothetical protein
VKDQWTAFHFSQSNPVGDRQGSVPDLLRRVASTIDELGSIRVADLTFKNETGAGDSGDDLTITVYYHRVAEE